MTTMMQEESRAVECARSGLSPRERAEICVRSQDILGIHRQASAESMTEVLRRRVEAAIAGALKDAARRAVQLVLDEPLNSGDGSYRP